MLGFNFLDGNFLNSPQAAQRDENCLKIESRKGNLYGAPNLSERYFKSAVDFKFVFLPHFIRRKNKMGSFLLVTFLWQSKEKSLALQGET
ncbi:hypothetical protein BKK47_04105 [Rodentibacter mrazii]|uniref:Uncharacterized protein n=1 Tax=Rodentibacter mrazii TaxID=1908257 RepID=A0A1V3IH10_9PAST|nr:hypothetical protein BKK47_04105 [Rodentibacter mrazii]